MQSLQAVPAAFIWRSCRCPPSRRSPADAACWSASCAAGVDRTDPEINAAEYGAAPDGYPFLVIGHESFGQVEAVGPNVTFLRFSILFVLSIGS